jgi:hypothetical protein
MYECKSEEHFKKYFSAKAQKSNYKTKRDERVVSALSLFFLFLSFSFGN